MPHPSMLIESWLPIEAVGAESRRENSTGLHPPPNRLHVWWARRPLIASRAAILAGVLPQWSTEWPVDLLKRFPNQETYQGWFSGLLGIRGDPVKAKRLIDWANQRGVRLEVSPYAGAPRAFTVNPSPEDLELMGNLLEFTWGTRDLSVLDPFAGGGSIPFEALRYGFRTFANDLNPVTTVILKATLDYPVRFGLSLADDIRTWGDAWAQRVRGQLAPYFPKQPGENIFAYLWARTVACPTTNKPVPLSPNWWLSKGDDPVAVRLIAEEGMAEPRFEILTGARARAAKPDVGTVSRGVGRSPWTGETIDGDYIKAEAQAGRMGQMLYAVVLKVHGGFQFRSPTAEDAQAVKRAEQALTRNRSEWATRNAIPTETRYIGPADRSENYGVVAWEDAFFSRQLLAMGIFVETLRELEDNVRGAEKPEKADAILTCLAVALDKAAIYDNRSCRFDPSRGIRSIFDRHDFAFVWSHAEFDASANLLPWVVSQVADAYAEMADLATPAQQSFATLGKESRSRVASITRGPAADLDIPSGSVHNITVDPPYYDNVMYAELADFFYVWLKRSVGHLFPELFRDELTNKDDEAVANPARFSDVGGSKKVLAEQDYERKMAAAFREMHRVLRPDGVLTVMFTHKRVEAWDTLASALIGAGFVIKASWPVHTESEHSLHQAKKNAASSTILMACRKREREVAEPVWWEDLQGRVRQVAREKAAEFAQQGIRGVDLYLSTFGPTLSILSEHWPVLTSEVDAKTGQPRPLRPETALDLAREEVVRLRKQGLLLGSEVQFDPVTDWYLMAWDAFGAEQFPYDEARKLAIALGVDLDGTLMRQKRLVAKKGSYVVLLKPTERRREGMVDDEVTSFAHWVDAVHTALMVYEEDGAGACDVFLLRTGLKRDTTFRACLQAMLNAIPRARIKGEFARPEAAALENMRLAFFDDLQPPAEEELEPQAEQMGLWEGELSGGDEEEDGEEE